MLREKTSDFITKTSMIFFNILLPNKKVTALLVISVNFNIIQASVATSILMNEKKTLYVKKHYITNIHMVLEILSDCMIFF